MKKPGKTASPEKSYSDGFIDGYQSIRGKGVVPAIPAHAIPAGYSPYSWGFEEGVKRASET